MECMDDLDGDGSSFGAVCVRAAFERHNRRAEVNRQNANARWGKGDANGIEYGADGHGGLGECARRNGDAFNGFNDGEGKDARGGSCAPDEDAGARKEGNGFKSKMGSVEQKACGAIGKAISLSSGANIDAVESNKKIAGSELNAFPFVATGCADVDSGNGRSVSAVVVKKATRTTIPKYHRS